MPISIDPVIASRVKAAWAALSGAQQEQILPLLVHAHGRLIAATRGMTPESHDEVEHALLFGLTALSDDKDQVLRLLPARSEALVDGAGAIVGTGKYEQLDPGWLESFAEWLEHLIFGRHGFVSNPVQCLMPDVLSLGLVGDWGTGNWRGQSNPSPSARVQAQVCSLRPELAIHLGDVYYAGTGPEEKHLLTCLWPRGSLGSAALNSNHEMYSGGTPYFKAISKAPFDAQRGCSYVSYENQNWIVVGLDSAYFARELALYKDGALFPADNPNASQVAFLQAQVQKGKRLIILTHHNGLTLDGTCTTLLWDQVTVALQGSVAPVHWYWGHVHSGVVYQPRLAGDVTMLCRCCGHGGLPGGVATDLEQHADTVQWYERRSAGDVDIPCRILNGFAVIALDGGELRETFFDENGGVAWSA